LSFAVESGVKTRKYKYITRTGEDAFGRTFDYASWFDGYGYAGVKECGRTFYINADGKATLETAYNLTSFDSDGLGLVHEDKGGDFAYGMLTVTGELFLPIRYESLGYPSCGCICAKLRGENLVLGADGQRLFGLGKFVFLDDDVFRDERLLVGRGDECYFMDTGGKIVHGPYWAAQMYCDGLAYVKRSEESAPAFVDRDGNVVMTMEKYDYVSEYWEHGVLSVQLERHYGLIDQAGAYVVEPVYDEMEALWNGYYVATSKKLRCVLDSKGSVVLEVPASIDTLRYGEEDVLTYERNNKLGYMKLPSGDLITDAVYDEAGPMRCGLAVVSG
jgi:hypothetical protein